MVEAHLIITGRVQGVGFRYYATRYAENIGIRGYVKNLADGSVEILAEGEEEQIEQFKDRLEKGSGYARIDDISITFKPYEAKYQTFGVEY